MQWCSKQILWLSLGVQFLLFPHVWSLFHPVSQNTSFSYYFLLQVWGFYWLVGLFSFCVLGFCFNLFFVVVVVGAGGTGIFLTHFFSTAICVWQFLTPLAHAVDDLWHFHKHIRRMSPIRLPMLTQDLCPAHSCFPSLLWPYEEASLLHHTVG